MSAFEPHSGRQLLLENIGLAVLDCQLAERFLRRGLVWAFPQEPELQFDRLAQREEKTRRASMGQLQSSLHQRYSVGQDFGQQLGDFIRDRNILIHGLYDMPGFGLGTPDELIVGIQFASDVRHKAQTIRHALAPIIAAWAEVAGNAKDMDWWADYHNSVAVTFGEVVQVTRTVATPNQALQPTSRKARRRSKRARPARG